MMHGVGGRGGVCSWLPQLHASQETRKHGFPHKIGMANLLTSFSKLTRLSRKVLFPSWMNVTSKNEEKKIYLFAIFGGFVQFFRYKK